MKTIYFEDNKSYFEFVNKNRNKKFNYFIVSKLNKIKVVYQFI